MLHIVAKQEGTCQLCCQPAIGCQCRFKDGLRGFFCQECMWTLFERRADKGSDQPKTDKSKPKIGSNQA